MAQGTYTGSVAISGGSNSADNQTIPVSMRVTTLPIAVPSTDRLTVRLAEGAPPLQYPFSPIVSLSNAGQGTLTVNGTTATAAPGIKNGRRCRRSSPIDPTGLPVGTSSGSITFTTNAVNGDGRPFPSTSQIVPKGPP